MNSQTEAAINALARVQHGVFSRTQALDAGVSTATIDRHLAAGRWLRLDRRVYALPGNPPTWQRQLKAAELSVGDAVVSGTSAAALLGFPGFRPGRPEITVPLSCRSTSLLARVRHRDGIQHTVRDRIRVTTPTQTMVDLAGVVSPERLRKIISEADGARVLGVMALAAMVDPANGLRTKGIGPLRDCVAELLRGTDVTPTVLEAALRRLLRQSGIEGVTFEFEVPWRSDGKHRADAAIPAAKILIEADSYQWHSRVGDFEADRLRDQEAARHGWITLRFTYLQLMQHPEQTLATIVETVTRRLAERRFAI